MDHEILSWKSMDDLIEQIKNCHKKEKKIERPVEIERQWIIDPSMIDYLKSIVSHDCNRYDVLQGYLSVEPEIRLYRINEHNDKENPTYHLTHKSTGNLIREEYEITLTRRSAMRIINLIEQTVIKRRRDKLISKEFYQINYNGILYHASHVDGEDGYSYMEIEFDSEETANNFKLPEELKKYVRKEVTNEPFYKMKNYWKRTRI